MPWGLILEIVGVIGGIATLLALMLGPMFYLGTKIENLRKSMDENMRAFRSEIRADMNEFRAETKDFHGRLCTIEERNK